MFVKNCIRHESTPLSFTPEPNLVIRFGVHSSLHPNHHHQIIFSKFNLATCYLPPFIRLVWNYQQASTDLIKQAIELFDWEKSLSNLDVNKQISVFKEKIINIFWKFYSARNNPCNDKYAPWMNKQIKTLIAEKNTLYKRLK